MSAPKFGSRKKVSKSDLRGTRHGGDRGPKPPAQSLLDLAKPEPIRRAPYQPDPDKPAETP